MAAAKRRRNENDNNNNNSNNNNDLNNDDDGDGGDGDGDDLRINKFIEWLTAHGGDLEGITIRRTGRGYGIFAANDFSIDSEDKSTGLRFARVPTCCILTAQRALETKVARSALAKGASEDFAIACYVARSRFQTQDQHTRTAEEAAELDEFAPYINILPRFAPDPLAWPLAARELLHNTPLGDAVERSRMQLMEEYESVQPADVSFDQLLWARGVRNSRFYPSSLAKAASLSLVKKKDNCDDDDVPSSSLATVSKDSSNNSNYNNNADGDDNDVRFAIKLNGFDAPKLITRGHRMRSGEKEENGGGVKNTSQGEEGKGTQDRPASESSLEFIGKGRGDMIPLYDFLNHDIHAKITWEAMTNGFVTFRVGSSYARGEEIFNNYGPKPNEELLSTYGFCVENNPLDSCEIWISQEQQHPASESGNDSNNNNNNTLLITARLQHLRKHDIKWRYENGCLKVGPFAIQRNSHLRQDTNDLCEEIDDTTTTNDNVIPVVLFTALGILALESPDDDLEVTPDELDQILHVFQVRLNRMKMSSAPIDTFYRQLEHCDDNEMIEFMRECHRHATVYREGQISLLEEAIAEIQMMYPEEDF